MADSYDLKEVIQELKDEHPPIIIHANGKDYRILPAELWPDQSLELGATEPVTAARGLMMDDNYDEFVADGGSAGVLMHIVAREAVKQGKA